MKERFDKVKKEDFIIRIRPYIDREGSWNGDIDVAIITQPENNLDDEDYFQVMHFCKMIASTIPVMTFSRAIHLHGSYNWSAQLFRNSFKLIYLISYRLMLGPVFINFLAS